MALWTMRKARKRHRRDRCMQAIEPGATYWRAALPPYEEENSGPGWWTLALHGQTDADCPFGALPWKS